MLVALAAGVGVGCAAGPAPPAAAVRCGALVRLYLGLPDPVAVREHHESDAGGIVIRYASSDGENLPVEGTARCRFDPSAADPRTPLAVTVDGRALDPGTLAALARRLEADGS